MRLASIRLAPILRVTGVLLMLFSVAQLVPVAVAVAYQEQAMTPFLVSFGVSLAIGGVLWLAGRADVELRSREGFLITVFAYLGVGLTGAIPLFLVQIGRASCRERV